jgi:hypothetical protein
MKNLKLALSKFSEDLWIPFEDSIGCIDLAINGDMIDKSQLINEFSIAISDKSFDWIQLATESALLLNPLAYSNIEICNYVKWLLSDYLYPEKRLTDITISKIRLVAIKILQDIDINDGWLFSYELFEELQKKIPSLEYYNLWDLIDNSMEIRRIKSKEREIGFIKYNKI